MTTAVRLYPYAMSGDDYDDPKVEARWVSEQREIVERYLEREEVRHGGVGPQPEWFVAPYVAVWRVESRQNPGAVGWWVVSGDLPTDYLSSKDAGDARSALAALAARWQEASVCMLRGEEHPDMRIGNSENRRELGELLGARAGIFKEWADDDAMW
jgi:hypothetical protein